jgi:membrane protein YdbS with pleckstrin-like domain
VVAEYRLHPRLPVWWAQIAAVVTALPATAGIIVAVVAGSWLLAPAIAIALALVPRLVRAYGRRYVERFRCELRGDGLRIQRGVWWRSEMFVPRERVQHTDVDQGPLARRWGIATLKVFTAGSVHSEIEIDGLSHTDTLRLRDAMIEGHDRGSS